MARPTALTGGRCLSRSSLNLSNGETESVKTMIVHDDVESEPAMTPSKEGTLIVRQVPMSLLPRVGGWASTSLTHLLIHSLMLSLHYHLCSR